MDRRKQFRSVGIDETFDLAAEESGFKQRLKDRLLRNQFIPHRIANRLGQTLPVPWNHSLRPDRDAQKSHRPIRMKQHPDRQPGRAITVHCGNDHNRQTDQDFEDDWIDGAAPGY